MMNINIEKVEISAVSLCCEKNAISSLNASSCNFNAVGVGHNLAVREIGVQTLRLAFKKGRRIKDSELNTITEDILRKSGLTELAFTFEPIEKAESDQILESLQTVLSETRGDSTTLQENIISYANNDAFTSNAAARAIQVGASSIAWYGEALYTEKTLKELVSDAGGKEPINFKSIDVKKIIYADLKGYIKNGTKGAIRASAHELVDQILDYFWD